MGKDIIKQPEIASKIYFIRGQKIILDMDLAILYNVETKNLKRAVTRHIERFPKDFMFELTRGEYKFLRCQIGALKTGQGQHSKYLPMAFTEQGIAMLSSVLNSKQAIQVNIQIMRTFTKLRELILSNKDLKLKIIKPEKQYKDHDEKINLIFKAIKQLLDLPKPKKDYKIGFKPD